MILPTRKGLDDLDVRRGANLKVDTVPLQVFNQQIVFDATNAMSDTRWLKLLQCLPHALWAAGFTGVRSAMESQFVGTSERGNMSIERVSRLVACNIERNDMAAAKIIQQLCGRKTLLAREVPQCAKDEPRLHS